jgi:hypothetical protein
LTDTVDWNTNSLTSWGMNEVTANNEILKSSVFHRLIQRAFPGWFPYNSVRFFHPFYTAQQNATFAKAQGYASGFKMSPDSTKNDETGLQEYDVSGSSPSKPQKPVYVTDFASIRTILDNHDGNFVHPALLHAENLPQAMQDVLSHGKARPESDALLDHVSDTQDKLSKYLAGLMLSIAKRELVAMTPSSYQVDATRECVTELRMLIA